MFFGGNNCIGFEGSMQTMCFKYLLILSLAGKYVFVVLIIGLTIYYINKYVWFNHPKPYKSCWANHPSAGTFLLDVLTQGRCLRLMQPMFWERNFDQKIVPKRIKKINQYWFSTNTCWANHFGKFRGVILIWFQCENSIGSNRRLVQLENAPSPEWCTTSLLSKQTGSKHRFCSFFCFYIWKKFSRELENKSMHALPAVAKPIRLVYTMRIWFY